MIEIKRILCPIDLATDLNQPLRYASALARAYEARLLICYRPGKGEWDGREANRNRLTSGLVEPKDGRADFERALLKSVGAEVLKKLDWQGLLIGGEDVAEAIAQAASEFAVDLIVMRSRRRPHRAALLGSTSESVCRAAPSPVLVTHSDQRDWVEPVNREIKLGRVLVAHDFSDYSELALKYAVSLAQEYQAELHILHVLPSLAINEPEIFWYPEPRESAYDSAARRLQGAVPSEAHLWCEVKHAISEGHAYREILSYSEKHGIDLISIGAHGAGFGMGTLFGSNVDRVLRQAPCPVLVARPLRPSSLETVVQAHAEYNQSMRG